ncbi:MAG: asparagine synthase C-terminal domain-containing protein [Candidatus Methanomethylicia archaeon]
MYVSIENFKDDLLKILYGVVSEDIGEGILLSGGLDTSILAYLLRRYVKPEAVTVCYGYDAPDLYYAKIVAEFLGLKHHVKSFTVEDALGATRSIIRILGTFDPMEIRNDIPLYIGLRYAKSLGLKSIVTGDGGDELFAGYPFLFKLKCEEVEEWIRNVSSRWFFAAKPLGESIGLRVIQPFTNTKIVGFALKIPVELKIGEFRGVKYGKWILRKVFEEYLPSEVIWRPKNPLEIGSGSVKLSEIFRVDNYEFRELSKIVKLRDAEQAFYFKIYLEIFKEPPKPGNGEYKCPSCGGGVKAGQRYCRVCGYYPLR